MQGSELSSAVVRELPDCCELGLCILGSGSSGNAAYVETAEGGLLVDAGFSGKQMEARLNAIGRSLDHVRAVLLTHEHADHVAGLPVVARKLGRPVYCTGDTADALRGELAPFSDWRCFRAGERFEVLGAEVSSFPIPHDAADPVGFTIRRGGVEVGFFLDLGYATKLVLEHAKRCHALVLEANHDLELMRQDVKRPWAVKQRILSRHGHLSNESAANVLEEVAWEGLRHLFLGHLSADCNCPKLAEELMRKRLAGMGRGDVVLHVARQDVPTAWVRLA